VGRTGSAKLALFGAFALTVDDEPVAVPEAGQRLLAYLALRGRPQSRSVVAGDLWPEKDERRAAANLRSSLWRLRCPRGVEVVRCCAHSLVLDPEMQLDVRDAEQHGWQLVREGAAGLAGCDCQLFLQELLPGWYDDWVIFERERLMQLQIRFLDALSRALVDNSQVVEGLDVALRLVAIDPFRERSQETLVRAYLAEGDVRRAHCQIESYSELMRDTFGCRPTPQLRQLLSDALSCR
jgi:DNA-binding SARP family transcriptional activator